MHESAEHKNSGPDTQPSEPKVTDLLPTSSTYPDAVMGTRRRVNKYFLRCVRRIENAPDTSGGNVLYPLIPYLQAIWLHGKKLLQRTGNASQGTPCVTEFDHVAIPCPSRLGNVDPIPFREARQSLRKRSILTSYDRLTHVQRLFTWNPSPRRPFNILSWQCANTT